MTGIVVPTTCFAILNDWTDCVCVPIDFVVVVVIMLCLLHFFFRVKNRIFKNQHPFLKAPLKL